MAAWIYEFVISTNATFSKLKHFFTNVDYSGDILYDVKTLKDPCQPGEQSDATRDQELEIENSEKEVFRLS